MFLQFQELVSIPTKSRDYKGILISLMVIMFLVGMVALTIKAVTPPPGPPRYLGNLKSNYEIHTKSGHLDTEWFMNRLNLDPSLQTLSMPPGCQVPLKKNPVYQIFTNSFSFLAGTKLAFINQNGGLSVFDIVNGTTEEIQDHTTFVR